MSEPINIGDDITGKPDSIFKGMVGIVLERSPDGNDFLLNIRITYRPSTIPNFVRETWWISESWLDRYMP